jgi:hypothetical protein
MSRRGINESSAIVAVIQQPCVYISIIPEIIVQRKDSDVLSLGD